MLSKTEAAARRPVAELSRAAGGRLKQMRSLQQTVDHAGDHEFAQDRRRLMQPYCGRTTI
jgi:hypothetical protein